MRTQRRLLGGGARGSLLLLGRDQFRQRQADLIAQGKCREAIQMDIDDIRSKFGSKYDESIREMLEAFGSSE